MTDLTLDRTDRRMLDVLQRNGRVSNLELAEAVGLSPAQSHRRHKRLEEQGFIRHYEARLDAARLDLGVIAFIHIAMEKGHVRDLPTFTDAIAAMPEVLECYSVTGDFDYVVKLVARDLRSLSEFLMGRLILLPGVNGMRSSVCLSEIKCSGALPIPP